LFIDSPLADSVFASTGAVDGELVVSLEEELDDPPDPEVDTLVAEFSVVDEVVGHDTVISSRRSWATKAASSLVLNTSQLPRADAMELALAASKVRILLSRTTLAARRLSSVMNKTSTLAGVVPAALAMAFLYRV
jgi:hypothetical protein